MREPSRCSTRRARTSRSSSSFPARCRIPSSTPRWRRWCAALAMRPATRRWSSVSLAPASTRPRGSPTGRIMRDEAVLEIAAHAPKTIAALARTRSLGKGVAEGKLGREILAAIAEGLADPDPPPAIPAKAEAPPGIGPLIELLRVLLKQRCEHLQVAQKLLASADDLEAIAADDNAPVRALSGWRRDVFGNDALALKHGRLALTAGRNRIELVPLPERGEPATRARA